MADAPSKSQASGQGLVETPSIFIFCHLTHFCGSVAKKEVITNIFSARGNGIVWCNRVAS